MITPLGSKPTPPVAPALSEPSSAAMSSTGTAARTGMAVVTPPVAPLITERPARLSDEVRALLSAPPPIDLARVERLRAAIAEGSYAIEPDRIAAAMIADDLGPDAPV